MPTDFTVRGSFTAFHPPERATVHASLAFEGAAMQPVYDRVAREFETVKATITPLHDAEHGAVTWWSAEQLRTWANRPWNKDGKQLPLVHHASIGLQVKFRDFTAMSRWVGGHLATTGGFTVSHVEWALKSNRRDEVLRQVRAKAVQDAVTRAQQYADALGRGKVRPVAIADAGMLVANLAPTGGPDSAYLRASGAMAGGAAEMELVPRDIEVSASVDARFVADEG